jgi:hypothetical protein
MMLFVYHFISLQIRLFAEIPKQNGKPSVYLSERGTERRCRGLDLLLIVKSREWLLTEMSRIKLKVELKTKFYSNGFTF